MASKKSKANGIVQYLSFVMLVLGVATFVMLFMGMLKDSGDGIHKGTAVVFGSEFKLFIVSLKFKFNILGFLAFLLPLLAGIISIFPVKKKSRNIKFLICALLFIVGAILIFLMPSYTKVYFAIGETSTTYDASFKLAIGAILGGVFAILGGLTSLGAVVLK